MKKRTQVTIDNRAAPAPVSDDPAQAYALRVWDGQSVSLARKERVRRVEAALVAQGLDPAGVQLPGAGQ